MLPRWQNQKEAALLWDWCLPVSEAWVNVRYFWAYKRAQWAREKAWRLCWRGSFCIVQPLGRWCKLWGVSASLYNHETVLCLTLIGWFLTYIFCVRSPSVSSWGCPTWTTTCPTWQWSSRAGAGNLFWTAKLK